MEEAKDTHGSATPLDNIGDPSNGKAAEALTPEHNTTCEGLVFGDIEDEEVFSTPLSQSRASSGALDSITHYTGFHSSAADQSASPTALPAASNNHSHAGTDAAARNAAAEKPGEAKPAGSADATTGDKGSQLATGTAGIKEAASGAAGAASSTSTSDLQAPQLQAAATAAATATETAADVAAAAAAAATEAAAIPKMQQLLPEPQVWREGSGLVTLAVPGQRNSAGSADGSEESGSESDNGAGWSAYEQAAASSSAGGAAAAAWGHDAPSSASSGPRNAKQQQQQQQSRTAAVGPPGSSSSSAFSAAAAQAADSSPGSPATAAAVRQRQHTQQQQQQQAGLSPPCSPLSRHSMPGSPMAGLERTASWQLQHAAAAAAGTAAHTAPPRSDLHLTRLSSSPGSPHAASDDGWSCWQRRRRHVFVLTAAGKPVFSRHGDEQALAGFMAVIQALVSVVADQGDTIASISVGPATQLVFLLRGQLYLVAVSSRGEAPAALRRQLELLYQSILMVVTGGIEKLLHRNPGYDMHQLLSGSKGSMLALTSAYGDCPGWMFGSIEPAAAAVADRQAAAAALQDAVKSSEALYGIVLVGRRVLVVATGSGPPPLNVYDLLLLINFTASNKSLRHSETFVPVCLPNFQPNAFLHAYITNLEPSEQQQQVQQQHSPQQQQQQQRRRGHHSHDSHDSCPSSMFLLLLSGSANSFHKLSAARQAFTAALAAPAPAPAAAAAAAAAIGAGGGGVLARAQAAAALPGGGRLRAECLPAPVGGPVGSTPLWHAIIRYPQRRQHITLQYPGPLFPDRSQRKQLVRSYVRLFCAAYSQLLESPSTSHSHSHGTSSGTSGTGTSGSSGGAGLGLMGPPVTPGYTGFGGTGSVGGGMGGAAGSIASIVGAAGGAAGGVGSGAAAAAAAAAAYVLPYAGGGGAARPHKLVWVTNQRWVTGVLVDREVELFITFDPLTEKEVGLKLAEQLRRVFADKAKQQELLVSGM